MDSDVEMVVRRDDEVGPAEDLNSLTVTESRLHGQNRWFTAAMVLCLVVMLFWIGNLYQMEDEFELGEIPEGLDNEAVAAGVAQLNHSRHHHGKPTHVIHNHTTANGGDTENDNSMMDDNDMMDGNDTMGGNDMMDNNNSMMGSPTDPPTTAPVAAPTTAKPSTGPTEMPAVAATLAPTIPGDNDSSPTVEASDVQAWLDASVTLDDGVKYEVVKQLNHDERSFTEGYTYCDSTLYESVGMRSSSAVLVLDAETGDTLERYGMESKYFGEGLTCVDDRLIQLTYRKKTGFVYDRNDLSKAPTTFHFDTTTGEGWGLTYDADRHELIVSDGSEFLHFWDPDTLEFKRKVAVTRLGGSKANNINELEYWRGRVIANVWYRDFLLVIHPETGAVEKEYDCGELWSSEERTEQGADVLNGISVSEDPDALYLTGKYWDRAFLVR